MNDQAILLLLVFVPILGSLLLPVIGRFSKGFRNVFALACVLVSFAASLLLVHPVLSGATLTISYNLGFGSCAFVADRLAVFMALVSSLVGAIIVLYSFDYISHYENQNEYYFMVVLFLGSMMGLVFAGNLVLLYVFWELTAIASWRLIGFFREREHVMRADKSFLVTFMGALVMLIGFICIYKDAGSFDLPAIKAWYGERHLPSVILLLVLAGLLSKSATLPLQTWLPDAGVAPSPVTALLHAAVLVKIGVYVFARLLVATCSVAEVWHTVVPVIAAVSALVAAGAALVETDLKRIIAYSTISQIGFIFLGFSIGNAVATTGAMLYILMHGLAKGGLFLCAGIVEQNSHTKDITKLGGLIKTMPVTAVAFLVCAFSVMGIPPTGGFFAKYLVISGSAASGHLWITLVFVAVAFLTIIYLMRVFTMIFMGTPKTAPVREGSAAMVFSVALLAALSVAGGILINLSWPFAELATGQMLGSL